jgi:glycine oxidase
VRGLVRGVPVYIVPRQDGTVVIGATQREDDLGEGTPAGIAVSAGGVYQLLRDAQQLVPAVAELELLEATARARPGTPDHAPLLGRVGEQGLPGDVAGLVIATGFFRHGILLAPAAAEICRQLLDGVADQRWAHFRPDRFAAAPAAADAKTDNRDTSSKPQHSKETL